MQIDLNLLISFGATTKLIKKGQLIFTEGSEPRYFYQVVEGSVKVLSTNDAGKELIQGVFRRGESFGEPPLFVNRPYPSSAITSEDSTILKLSKEKFFNAIQDHPVFAKYILQTFAQRIYDKATTAQILVSQSPEEKIIGFLEKLKKESNSANHKLLIPYTRQQIADFTGLRVETVIRTLTKLKDENKVEIINHKVYH